MSQLNPIMGLHTDAVLKGLQEGLQDRQRVEVRLIFLPPMSSSPSNLFLL